MSRRKRELESLEQDIRAHIEEEIRENVERGMGPEEARRAALLKFGNPTRVVEDTREVWFSVWAEQLLQDLRYGVRILRRSPGFAGIIIATFAVGIGMNTAVFSVINAVLLRSLPYPNADRLAWMVTHSDPQSSIELVSESDYFDWEKQSQSFDNMALFCSGNEAVGALSGTIQVPFAAVTKDFWKITGGRAALGRLFRDNETNAIVLTYALFVREFGADPSILGRSIRVGERKAIVAGVLEPGFRTLTPRPVAVGFGADPAYPETELYSLLELPPWVRVRGGLGPCNILASLKPGVQIAKARAEIEAIESRIDREHPNPNLRIQLLRPKVELLKEKLTGSARRTLLTLGAGAQFVFLIACVNVASLLLARSTSRRREMAIRVSIGAGKSRILRQLLAEILLLALPGGATALILARAVTAFMIRYMPLAVPRLSETDVDRHVLFFTLALSIVGAFLSGFAPALSLWKRDVSREWSNTSQALTRQALAAAELCMAIVLLIGAGLFLKGFLRIHSYPSGFEPEHTLVLKVNLEGERYRTCGEHPPCVQHIPVQTEFVRQFLHRVNSLPGVKAAGIMNFFGAALRYRPANTSPIQQSSTIPVTGVSPDFARAMGMKIIKGRWLTAADDKDAAVINESTARMYFLDRDPLGESLTEASGKTIGPIKGVVRDLKYTRLDVESNPEVYVPYQDLYSLTAVVHVVDDPIPLIPTIRGIVHELDSDVAMYDAKTVEEQLSDSIVPRRFILFLLTSFAGMALLLAVTGIHGVIAYSVAQRTNEIGVRMARGAGSREIAIMVVGEVLRIVLAGIVLGLIAALALSRLIANLLFGVNPNDMQTFVAVAALALLAAVLACFVPVANASRVEPLVALRHD